MLMLPSAEAAEPAPIPHMPSWEALERLDWASVMKLADRRGVPIG